MPSGRSIHPNRRGNAAFTQSQSAASQGVPYPDPLLCSQSEPPSSRKPAQCFPEDRFTSPPSRSQVCGASESMRHGKWHPAGIPTPSSQNWDRRRTALYTAPEPLYHQAASQYQGAAAKRTAGSAPQLRNTNPISTSSPPAEANAIVPALQALHVTLQQQVILVDRQLLMQQRSTEAIAQLSGQVVQELSRVREELSRVASALEQGKATPLPTATREVEERPRTTPPRPPFLARGKRSRSPSFAAQRPSAAAIPNAGEEEEAAAPASGSASPRHRTTATGLLQRRRRSTAAMSAERSPSDECDGPVRSEKNQEERESPRGLQSTRQGLRNVHQTFGLEEDILFL